MRPTDGRKALPKATKDTVAALYISGVKPTVIAQQLGLNIKTIRTWIQRRGLCDAKQKVSQIKESVSRPLVHHVSKSSDAIAKKLCDNGLSDKIRQQLQSELEAQLATLRQEPVSYDSLPTTKGTQGRVALVKGMAETAALVFPDWSDSSGGLVIVGEMERSQDTSPTAVEIESSVVTPQHMVYDAQNGNATAEESQDAVAQRPDNQADAPC